MCEMDQENLRKIMKDVKNLSEVSKEEQKKFIDSFDTVLIDCDGVLWNFSRPIFPDTDKVLTKFENLQKSLYFVTNNTFRSPESVVKKFENTNFCPTEDMIINPVVSIIRYLKSINFNKSILVAAPDYFKDELIKADFCIVEPCKEKEDILKTLSNLKFVDKSVGAVILDAEPNLTISNMNEIITAVSNPENLFIIGACEKNLQIKKNLYYIGPGMIQQLVIECSGRKPLLFGKPGKELSELVKDYLKIEEPRKVLFVGDLFQCDMSFASISGFQKLLILSKYTEMEEYLNSDNPDYVPDYYLDSFADLLPILNNIKQ